MYKIRLTDTITIKAYSILKPEVEMDFEDDEPMPKAIGMVERLLENAANQQMDTIVHRMTKLEKQRTLTDVSVDTRFIAKIRASL